MSYVAGSDYDILEKMYNKTKKQNSHLDVAHFENLSENELFFLHSLMLNIKREG